MVLLTIKSCFLFETTRIILAMLLLIKKNKAANEVNKWTLFATSGYDRGLLLSLGSFSCEERKTSF